MDMTTSPKESSHNCNLDWIEWICHTNFSFLSGASHPEDYIRKAIEYGYKGIGISDFNGVYGIITCL